MKVSEIANGSEVKIYAAINGHSVVIMTEAIFGVNVGLLVRPMEYFGKYIQFLEPSNVQIRNKRDGRVYKFMSTAISPVKTRYGNFHLIRCSSMLEPENSRRAERFYIEKLGLISVNGNNMQLRNCLVHDISMRGISLVVDDDTECVPGDKIDVMFRYGATLHNYELSTVVVRNFKLGKKNAVGCSISNLNIDLIGLLSSKKNEKQTKLDEAPATDLNPKITEQQQILEVEEDVARDIIPERPATITIRSGKQMNLKDMEESADSDDMAILRKNKEKKMADERREIESLLDLRNI
ncbi:MULTISPECIES: PilZ domain-containing protein [Butyrivibrio]|uniref:PilZ domain-containing protein n=1 Tax=Butyrivibrio TaxID=830 RepID=UPI0003FF342E|nr:MULTISPECIES: PilZ domain-containing protein [Butyrivibrio]